MTPEQENRIREIIREEMNSQMAHIFQKHLQLLDGRNIIIGTATGTKIGTETTQKVGFLGKAPVARQAAISDPAGGATQDAQARTAINSLIDVLQAFGFIA